VRPIGLLAPTVSHTPPPRPQPGPGLGFPFSAWASCGPISPGRPSDRTVQRASRRHKNLPPSSSTWNPRAFFCFLFSSTSTRVAASAARAGRRWRRRRSPLSLPLSFSLLLPPLFLRHQYPAAARSHDDGMSAR
jgi:hypothetical protein